MSIGALVSIVIPTYSRPLFLKRCVDSVLNQTYGNIEVIVVDDNDPETSERVETENTMQIYKEDKRVLYLRHEKNRNGSAARNTGWRASRGEYVAFIDDDDEMHPSRIEQQVRCLEQLDQTWGVCYSLYQIKKEDGSSQISVECRSGYRYIDALMRTFYVCGGSNLLVRRSVLDEIGGFDESFQRNQDIEFLARALEHNKIAFIKEVLLTIYQQGARKKRSFEEIDEISQYYLSKFASRIDALGPEDKRRVIAVISLDRFRCALSRKKMIKGLKILWDNKVSFRYLYRYFRYLFYRKRTHYSFGFTGEKLSTMKKNICLRGSS